MQYTRLYYCYFYFIKFNGVSIPISISIQVIIMHTLLSYLILIVIEKLFFKEVKLFLSKPEIAIDSLSKLINMPLVKLSF